MPFPKRSPKYAVARVGNNSQPVALRLDAGVGIDSALHMVAARWRRRGPFFSSDLLSVMRGPSSTRLGTPPDTGSRQL